MNVKRFEVSRELSAYVSHFWSLERKARIDEPEFRFVPDGFFDQVFIIKGQLEYKSPNESGLTSTESAHIFGQFNSYIDLKSSGEELQLFGVKFYPWVSSVWIDEPMSERSGHLSPHKVKGLETEQLAAMSMVQRVALVEAHVTARLAMKGPHLHLNMLSALGRGYILREDLGIGRRRLQQLYREHIGLSAQSLAKIRKVNWAIEIMKESPGLSFTQIALEVGYYDQSHFIRDFKQYTGYSPSKFMKRIEPVGEILGLSAE